jgi:hypothetical protein
MSNQQIIDSLHPQSRPLLIDLVELAGIDVSLWRRSRTGAANPKYCYEWCFQDDSKIVFNIWFDSLQLVDGRVICEVNMRERAQLEKGPRRRRALEFDVALQRAFLGRSSVKIIIQVSDSISKRRVEARALDTEDWHVKSLDVATGAAILQRGSLERSEDDFFDPALQHFVEGKASLRLSYHRYREQRLREEKLKQRKLECNGRLICEVPNCDFDFEAVYGAVGQGYAHVHHLKPLSDMPEVGGTTVLADLVVVCANCHAMIHRRGQNRPIVDLIPKPSNK